MSGVLPFQPKSKPASKVEGQAMVRVINIESPFWNWEGLAISPALFPDQAFEGLLVVFSHAGFQFPAMLFKKSDVRFIEPTTKKVG